MNKSLQLFKKLIKDKTTIIALVGTLICFAMYITEIDLLPEFESNFEFYNYLLLFIKSPSVLTITLIPILTVYSIIIYAKINKSKEIISRCKNRIELTTVQLFTNILLVTFIYVVSILASLFMILLMARFNVREPEYIQLPFVDIVNNTHIIKANVNIFTLCAFVKWYTALIAVQMIVYFFCCLFKDEIWAVVSLGSILFLMGNVNEIFSILHIPRKYSPMFYLGLDPGFDLDNINQIFEGNLIYFGAITLVCIILIYIVNYFKDIEDDERY